MACTVENMEDQTEAGTITLVAVALLLGSMPLGATQAVLTQDQTLQQIRTGSQSLTLPNMGLAIAPVASAVEVDATALDRLTLLLGMVELLQLLRPNPTCLPVGHQVITSL